MKRIKQITLAILITACIILLVWLFRPVRADVKLEKYAAAATNITAGNILELEDIVMVDLPIGVLSTDYCSSAEMLIGRTAVIDVSAGELISSNHASWRPRGLGYPFQSAGTRLMTIELPAESANGYWLAAGSRVDIDMFARTNDSEEGVISLENIEVAAVLSSSNIPGSSQTGTSTGRPLICLALNRNQALQLAEGLANRQVCLSVICPG